MPAFVATAVIGDVMQTPTPAEFEYLHDAVIAIDTDGVIAEIAPRASARGGELVRLAGEVVQLGSTEVLMPGLVDLHVHAPQWPQLGTCLDLPLEQWLFEYTFPLEARYGDLTFAQRVWSDLVPSMLRHGTTTAVYFVTNDEAATEALAAACLDSGQRAFVGRVAMDHPTGNPAWYRDHDARSAIDASARSVETIRSLDAGRDLVRPMITPRFTPSCTDELLAGLGTLAAASHVAVQTHCSESDWAHTYSLDRFGVTDTVALDRFGLLRPGSVLAHANHVTDRDADLIVSRDVGLAHCPLSNAYFADGVLPTRRLLDRGVRIGLGTDVAGGSSPGLLAQCRDAVTVSRMLDAGVDVSVPSSDRGVAGSSIDIVTAFWMATLGGATALDIPVGLIEPGRRFDALVVDTHGSASGLRVWPETDVPRTVFEKVIRLAGAAEITSTWVDGRRVATII
ncbi:amidohydrolase family protein [Ilumatobacter sp.]|uniref:amidohydrolase family protein n=1 Tax=Ilumatobacter sp. TaxID=1967498 RepID=UPI003C38D39A